MPTTELLDPPVSAHPWTVTTELRSYERCHIHTLRYTTGKSTTPIESRIGPHGKSLLIDICEHLNTTGGKPASNPKNPSPTTQTELI